VLPKHSKQVNAMIDTGATGSAVSKDLAEELHLEVIGPEIGIGMDGKPGPVPLRLGHITVPDLSCHWNRQILMQTGASQGLYDVIIGNDILQSCIFTVDGPAGRFTLRYVG
jgi:Aspartyl protease